MKKEEWDTVALERLELAIDPAKSADVAAVVMQEGIANLMLISGSLTLSRAKIDISVPRKRHGAAAQQHEKALARFFEAIVQAILRHVNFEIVKCVLIASPGFTKDQFYEHMMTFANKLGEGKILLVRIRIIPKIMWNIYVILYFWPLKKERSTRQPNLFLSQFEKARPNLKNLRFIQWILKFAFSRKKTQISWKYFQLNSSTQNIFTFPSIEKPSPN